MTRDEWTAAVRAHAATQIIRVDGAHTLHAIADELADRTDWTTGVSTARLVDMQARAGLFTPRSVNYWLAWLAERGLVRPGQKGAPGRQLLPGHPGAGHASAQEGGPGGMT